MRHLPAVRAQLAQKDVDRGHAPAYVQQPQPPVQRAQGSAARGEGLHGGRVRPLASPVAWREDTVLQALLHRVQAARQQSGHGAGRRLGGYGGRREQLAHGHHALAQLAQQHDQHVLRIHCPAISTARP
jgi:hypothetical protein